jgi:hypothetical protein
MSLAVAGGVAAGLVVAIAGGLLSRTLALDLITLWPVPAAAVALATVSLVRRSSPSTVTGLLGVSWLVLGLGLHLSEAPWLPSSAGDLTGPAVATQSATVALQLDDGVLRLEGGAAGGYSVRPIRRGGRVGVPDVFEQVSDDDTRLVVVDRVGSWWFGFEGWHVELESGPGWTIEATARTIEADLTGVSAPAVALTTTQPGQLALPGGGSGTVTLSGRFTVLVDPDSSVTITGATGVPASWTTVGEVSTSPREGRGWEVTVVSGAVEVVDG